MNNDKQKCIEQNHSLYNSCLTKSRELARRGHISSAVAYAELAATLGTLRHPGIFASPSLERMLIDCGVRLARGKPYRVRTCNQDPLPDRVLHVLTKIEIGGHIQLASRWIEQDANRRHSIAVISSGKHDIPPSLLAAVSTSGGELYSLYKKPGRLLARAWALRSIAETFDYVVLHTHPHDVVPLLALAEKNGLPPIIFMNHADHLFWLGVSIGDVFANILESGIELSVRRRGIEPERCHLLPIPIRQPVWTTTRHEAKARLGVANENILFLTIGSMFKYNSDSDSFITNYLKCFETNSHISLIAIGPVQTGEWLSAHERTAGRITALGPMKDHKDLGIYYQAADIYLDSYPVGGLTTVLEAASYGVPVVSYWNRNHATAKGKLDEIALRNKMIICDNLRDLYTQLNCLINDQPMRTTLGKSLQRSVIQSHTGEGWKGYLESLYRRAAALKRVSTPAKTTSEEVEFTERDLELVSISKNSGYSTLSVNDLIQGDPGLLPFRQRVLWWSSLLTRKDRWRIRMMLSSPSAGTTVKARALNCLRGLWGGMVEAWFDFSIRD